MQQITLQQQCVLCYQLVEDRSPRHPLPLPPSIMLLPPLPPSSPPYFPRSPCSSYPIPLRPPCPPCRLHRPLPAFLLPLAALLAALAVHEKQGPSEAPVVGQL
ncbi:hypothetical protein C8R44DRAFT_892379 [Mycena epipterygia]|nr:hypothetical protein C8R44DRAFT_892379 [Mycena epipterygia]